MNKTDKALACFKEGFTCSQAVFSTYAVEMGIDRDVALKVSQAFGGGMAQMGETCGAVTGAFMVIGLKYGRIRADDDEAKTKTYKLVKEFTEKFKARNGTMYMQGASGLRYWHYRWESSREGQATVFNRLPRFRAGCRGDSGRDIIIAIGCICLVG